MYSDEKIVEIDWLRETTRLLSPATETHATSDGARRTQSLSSDSLPEYEYDD